MAKSQRRLNFLRYVKIKKALSIEPDNGAYLDSLGWYYYRKGNYHEALRLLLIAEEKLGEKNITDSVVYDHIGDTYNKLKNYAGAVKYWEKSYKIKKEKKVKKKINDIKKSK